MDKDTKHIKDQSKSTDGYLEYTKEKEKGNVNQHSLVAMHIQGQDDVFLITSLS